VQVVSFYTTHRQRESNLHPILDIVLLAIALISSGLFAVAAEPRTRALVFGASLISFVGGLVMGHWM
jgi:hypothetical protein